MLTASDQPVPETIAAPAAGRSQLQRVLRVEWLAQTGASLCWIASVFAYGVSSSGDLLQLAAASCWLVANIASALPGEAD